jgi:flavin reductase (DIM6/NTAB) family NADH-FMN oxidoreductase RutF
MRKKRNLPLLKEAMMKKELGVKNCLYPLPVTLVGADVAGKANFITIAHVGIMDLNSISLGMAKSHYTNAGIKENGTFGVSIPSIEMAQVSDYCGLVSGKTVDKSKLFDVFYGKLKTAPMIRKCPINMECRLMKTVDFPKHDVFIGEIVETYVDEEYLTDGIVDFAKVQPILFVMNDTGYWKLGQRFANAWDIGKSLKSG